MGDGAAGHPSSSSGVPAAAAAAAAAAVAPSAKGTGEQDAGPSTTKDSKKGHAPKAGAAASKPAGAAAGAAANVQKRGPSAYMNFINETRAEMMAKNPGLPSGGLDMARRFVAAWGRLSLAEKAAYNGPK